MDQLPSSSSRALSPEAPSQNLSSRLCHTFPEDLMSKYYDVFSYEREQVPSSIDGSVSSLDKNKDKLAMKAQGVSFSNGCPK